MDLQKTQHSENMEQSARQEQPQSEQGQTMPLIVCDHVSRVYADDFGALRDVSLAIARGEFVSIVGVSGAGKSTLLKMIYAQEQPSDGEVYFNGRPISSIERKLLPFFRRNFGTVFQDFKLLEQKTVFENVAYALEVIGASDEQIASEVPKILEIVGLEAQAQKYPRQISGGEEQRVSLARALIHRPKVLIADEPTGNLDPASTEEIMQLLQKINEFGTTVVLATHDQGVVNTINRRVITMDAGVIVQDRAQGGYAQTAHENIN